MPDYSMGGFGSDNTNTNNTSMAEPSGPISFDTQVYNRGYNPKNTTNNSLNDLNSTVQTMMRGYLRRDDTGGYLPLTSAAPQNFLQSFTPLDRYRSFGVPLTGQSLGQTSSFDALFSPAPGGSSY